MKNEIARLKAVRKDWETYLYNAKLKQDPICIAIGKTAIRRIDSKIALAEQVQS
jgi:hypothetical protein